ncbi:MAG: glycosyltransferase family 4 protein [Beijerinckiaceae bacterium]
MIPLAFCIPGDIDLPTGGYRYDREVLKRLPSHGVAARHLPLGAGFPHPSNADIDRAMNAMSAEDRRSVLLIDGLALGALPPDRIAALPHRLVALVHHPLGMEAGTPLDRARWLLSNERAVLSFARHTIVTSPATKAILRKDFALADRSMTVAEPGCDRHPRAVGTGSPLQILAVGAVSPRKAFPQLVGALADVGDLDWRLTIAGSLDLSPAAAAELQLAIDRSGLAGRITLAGALDDAALAECYDRADVFAMSSLFEGDGRALSEALSRGLPIVTSSGGAAAETVPDAAALKVPPGDAAALTEALRRVMTDAALRRRMGDAAWAAAALLPSWDDTAREIADVVKAL